MDLLFPIGIAILLILFLVTNFELVATLVNYLLMACLIAVAAGAIGYGLYNFLGPEMSIFLAVVAAGVLTMTKVGYSIASFFRAFAEGYRAGPVKKA